MLGGGRNPAVLSRRDGADDEGTRRVVEGDGQEDHMVVGGGNSGGNGSDDAPVAREIGDGRLCGAGGSPQGKAECPAHSAGNDREGAGALQGDVLRPEHPALSRKAAERPRHRVELYLGAESAARSWVGGQAAQARTAPAATTTEGHAGDAVAHRREQAPESGHALLGWTLSEIHTASHPQR